jgi:hypothetical protein
MPLPASSLLPMFLMPALGILDGERVRRRRARPRGLMYKWQEWQGMHW